MSGKVVVNRSMSLDGFIAGPGDAMDWIFDFVTPDEAWLTEIAAATGAMLVGRRTDEVGDRLNANKERRSASSDEGYPFSGPVFVLTHEPRVTRDVGRQDGRQPPLHPAFTHRLAWPRRDLITS